MPFPQQPPRPFTKADVQSVTPNQMGCYGIFRQDGTPIYVGKGDIRQRLLDHLNGDIPCILRNQASYWLGSVLAAYDNEEKKLITEFAPLCNQKVG